MTLLRWGCSLLIGLFWTTFAGDSLAQSAIDLYAACQAKYQAACVAYAIAGDGTVLRERPDTASRAIQKVPFGSLVLLLEPFERKDNAGWLYVQALDENQSARVAWVRRDQIAAGWQFHRVAGCWPVAELAWTEDESGTSSRQTFRPRFDSTGSILIDTEDERQLYDGFAVYYAHGIFKITKVGNPRQALAPIFVLDYAKRRVSIDLYVLGQLEDPPFRLAPAEFVEKCKSIPTLDPKQPMMRMPKPASR